MTTNKKTLADVQPGGRVRLGDQAERARFEEWAGGSYDLRRMGDAYRSTITTDAWRAWQAALSAQPSLGGQDALLRKAYDDLRYYVDASQLELEERGISREDALDIARESEAALSAQPSPGGQDALAALQQDYENLLDSFDRQVEVAEKIAGRVLQQDDRIEELEEALAARQPVGQITDTEIDARLNALYREMVDSGQHNGGMSGVAWDRAVYRMASNQPSGNSGELDVDGARQAVGEPMDGCTESECERCRTHPAHRGEMKHAGISDFRQQVVEPVAYTSESQLKALQVCGDGIMSQRSAKWTVPLYTQPVQAVDLGRWSQRHADDLHVAVHTALSVHAGSLSQKKRAAISAYVKRLLIDSQAVGNG